jgi:Transposase DDE domain
LLAPACGPAIQRAMLPFMQEVLLYGLKTLFGIERINALPSLLFSDEALMPLVGFNAQQVRDGVCQRGAAKRQAERALGPMCPDTLANNIVTWHVRDLEGVFNGAIRALAKAGAFRPKVTGLIEGTDLETTERYPGGGQVTRPVRIEDTRGQVHEIEVTVCGWKVLLVIDAVTKIPLAVKVGKMPEHETHWTRALVTQARANLAGHARLHTVVFDRGFWDGTDLWWLDQQGLCFVVPAKATMAVTADARAQAAAGEGMTRGRRVHPGRHGQGRAARTERLETEVVGMTGLTTYDQYGTPEHARQHHRRDFQGNPLNAVVVRKWAGKD